jgi:mono/diheme cytochrome c family protein
MDGDVQRIGRGRFVPDDRTRPKMRTLPIIGTASLAVAVLALSVPARAGDAAAGKAVFEKVKPPCKGCHNDARNPLTKVGASNTPDEIKAWLRTPKEMMAKKGKTGVKPVFGPDKISDKDLDDLAAYLATMK